MSKPKSSKTPKLTGMHTYLMQMMAHHGAQLRSTSFQRFYLLRFAKLTASGRCGAVLRWVQRPTIQKLLRDKIIVKVEHRKDGEIRWSLTPLGRKMVKIYPEKI